MPATATPRHTSPITLSGWSLGCLLRRALLPRTLSAPNGSRGSRGIVPVPKYKVRRSHFGGCNSLLSQPITRSLCRGSGRSQSKHWKVRFPLPSGGSAKTSGAPHSGHVGRSAGPISQFCRRSETPSNKERAARSGVPQDEHPPGNHWRIQIRTDSTGRLSGRRRRQAADRHRRPPERRTMPGSTSSALRMMPSARSVYGGEPVGDGVPPASIGRPNSPAQTSRGCSQTASFRELAPGWRAERRTAMMTLGALRH
jgi:hypothetical protein